MIPSRPGAGYGPAMDDPALLSLAADLARRAGEVILSVRARGFETRHKADRTVVTEADHQAEALIVTALREATPYTVIAEEEVAAGHDRSCGRAYWLVDPLDGTREFASGHDEFTVNIGLIRDGRPVLGAVGVPATGEVFTGWLGPDGRREARKHTAAGEQPIRTRPAPASGLAVLASRAFKDDTRLAAFLRERHVASVTNYGSALKVCRISEGVADLYPRFGPTMEWDTAAPQAVLEAAGGRLTRIDGSPLGYGKDGWRNPAFVCSGC